MRGTFTKHNPCKTCGSLGHGAWYHKPRRALRARQPMRRSKRLRPLGKVGTRLAAQSKNFLAGLEPPYLCVYCLVLGYENFLEPEWVNIEHGQSKTRHPDRRFDRTNLYISCQFHNRDKGSLDIDQYIAKLRKEQHEQRANHQNPGTIR
jgi:5-methylcytosine-specific restriction endonuclease McrA